MQRITPIDPAQATGKARELFDGPLKAMRFNMFKAMASSGAALDGYVSFSGALSHGVLTAKEREVIALALAEANRCDYCLAAHTAIGKQVGLDEAQTLAARRGSIPADARLGALARFTLALHEKRGGVSDADVATFRDAGFGDGHLAEVVANYAINIYTNTFNTLNQTPVDFPSPAAI